MPNKRKVQCPDCKRRNIAVDQVTKKPVAHTKPWSRNLCHGS